MVFGKSQSDGNRPTRNNSFIASIARPSRHRRQSSNPLSGRLSTRRLSSNIDACSSNSQPFSSTKPKAAYRRYRVGERVLIRCNAHWTTLVNRYGFPPGEGTTAEEQCGPYCFVMATIKTVHFDEFAEYYTVERADNSQEQRADSDFIEPFQSTRGEQAALRAATQSSAIDQEEDLRQSDPLHASQSNNSACLQGLENCCVTVFMPLLWIFDCFLYLLGEYFCRWCNRFYKVTRRQAKLCLNGKKPWMCSVRLTSVNVVVACSTWYMFSDQLRFAFFPADADHTLAVVNLVVFCVLLLELLFELFIRPDGYQQLIISDKAYAPTTVRFINAFHLFVESISLFCFIPEFYCLFSKNMQCDERLRFSFFNAALMGVVGPTTLHYFYGTAYFALVRFRVFGLVRHWKKMWINNTFINMRWKAAYGFFLGSKKAVAPLKNEHNNHHHNHRAKKEGKKKETVLTNASNIGTALMVTNSYRAMIMLCAIVGIFPGLHALSAQSSINKTSTQMTNQLQATNVLVNDNSEASCRFLVDSISSWVVSLTPSEERGLISTDTDTYLLSLSITPDFCLSTISAAADDLRNSTTEKAEPNVVDSTNTTHLLGDVCDLVKVIGGESALNAELAGLGPVSSAFLLEHCQTWNKVREQSSAENIASVTDLRSGSIVMVESYVVVGNYTLYEFADNGTQVKEETLNNITFKVEAAFNETYVIQSSAISCFYLQFCVLVGVLGGLSVLRRDAEVLVLGPLRRMLRIVAGYAKNPLIQPKLHRRRNTRNSVNKSLPDHSDDTLSDSDDSLDGGDTVENDLGSYETEQLINAVSKITDLLRKCWGVAGADIISTNLATREGALTEVFNPTVPGKSVYALFGFAAINGFDHALKNLGGDVMVLINDVAKVLHDEVYRWGFGDSGQCNKNLGAAFLMVFRIGLVKEVIDKLEQATDVIFSTHTKNRAMSQLKQKAKARRPGSMGSRAFVGSKAAGAKLKAKSTKRKADAAKEAMMSVSLQSLPGISTFTDRAVIGMLKSYAGMHRDKKLLTWNDDFRLGAGVGAFTVSLIYGMDAGWAVEGAVGSEYKIDATYLSPHVNMASRMMSACKQYGVSILLSQAVQELMSDAAKAKLRHLDTVTVKGSSIKQRIYTYDARSRGVDFFLFSRTDDQADFEADRYTPNMWNVDQDLKAMRQHLTEDFLDDFRAGRKAYLQGDWPLAIEKLNSANGIMLESALEAGYLVDSSTDTVPYEDELAEHGDGASLFLLNYMKSKGGVAPDGWEGWHPLTSK